MTRMTKDYLSLAQAKRGAFKIGVSINVNERVREQSCKLLAEWYRPLDAFRIETLIKALMCNAGYRSRDHGVSREHFVCRRREIDAAIECAMAIADGEEPAVVLNAIQRIERLRQREAA